MKRRIKCQNIYGRIFNLTGLKNTEISKYEFLVPLNYHMIYSGNERFYTFPNEDIKDNWVGTSTFAKSITIINMNSGPINMTTAMKYEDDLELFKYIVAKCDKIVILFNDDNTIKDVIYYYRTNRNSMTTLNLVDHPQYYREEY